MQICQLATTPFYFTGYGNLCEDFGYMNNQDGTETYELDENTKRKDNLLGCEIGDAVTIESEAIKHCYTVINASYEEIGELSADAKLFY